MSHDDDLLPPSEGWQQLASVWKSSTTDSPGLDPALARLSRDRSTRLARTVTGRNTRELLGVAVLIGLGLYEAVSARTLALRLGAALMVAGALWIAAWLHRQGRNLTPPGPDATTSVHLAHEAAQLTRQIELLGNVRTHYLLPLLPSVVVTLVATFVSRWPPPGSNPDRLWAHVGLFAAVATLVAAVFAVVDALNRRAARRLREQRDRLLVDPASADGCSGRRE